MKTFVVPAAEDSAVEKALAVWQRDGLVAFPTDTVYGLAALPTSSKALHRLWKIKEQDAGTFIALLLTDLADLPRFATLPEALRPLTDRFWPGALTLMLPRTAAVPRQIGAGTVVGVRLPALPLARNLIRAAGGVLAVTGANRPGHPAGRTAREVLDQLDGEVELVIDGGPAPIGIVSTVVDGNRWPPVVLREGAISEAEIRIALGMVRPRGK